MPNQSVMSQGQVCSHCKQQSANLELRTYRPYCDSCWTDINQRKSINMKAKGIKRSNLTRAQMSASKRVKRDNKPEEWLLFVDFYKEQLDRESELKLKLSSLS